MATIPPFVRHDINQIPEDGPSLAAFPPPLVFQTDGPAITWRTVSGFTGDPVVTGDIAYRFGSLVKYGFTVAGLTAAPGLNVAQLSIPITRDFGPFTSALDAYGSVSAVTEEGQLIVGNIQAIAGGDFLRLAANNNTGLVQVLDSFNLQGMVTYHIV